MGHLPAYDRVEAGARPGKDGQSQGHASVPRASVLLAPCLWMARPWRCWGRRRPSTVTWEGSDLESQCTFCLKGFFSSCTIWHREQTGVREHTESRFWTWNSLRFRCSCVTSGRSLALSWPVFSSVKRTAVTRWGCVHSGRRLETNARSRVEGPIGWVFLPYCHLLCTLREWLSRLFQRR